MKDFVISTAALVAAVVIMMVALAISGCASSGFYNMSDSWCDAHPTASEVRCPGRTPAARRVDETTADGAISTNHPIWFTTAPLFTRTGPHQWTVSRVHVTEYPDARPVMCVATKDSQTVECFYQSTENHEGYEYTELPKEKRS